jgi:hypothetical protein
LHDAGLAFGGQVLKLGDDEGDGLRLRMWTNSRLVDCSSPDVGSLGTSGVNAFDGDVDVVDQLRQFQNATSFCLSNLHSTESTPSLRRSLNCVEDLGRGPEGIAAHVAFPNANDSPTERSEQTRHLPVTPTISFDLCNPI